MAPRGMRPGTPVVVFLLLLLLAATGCRSGVVEVERSVTAVLGQDVVLPCRYRAQEGEQVVQVTWLKRGPAGHSAEVAVLNRQHGEHVQDAYAGRVLRRAPGALEDGAIVLRNAVQGDEGDYECHLITFPMGSFEGRLTLKVLVPPLPILNPGPPLEEGQGQTLAASCTAEGSPVPSVRWETEVRGTNTTRRSVHSRSASVTSEFFLVPGRSMNGKSLTCVVAHPGLRHEKRITHQLSVAYLSDASVLGHSEEWAEGMEGATLTCLGDGNPPPTYNWTRLNAPLPAGVRVKGDTLVFQRPLAAADAGDYVCRVANRVATKEARANVSVKGRAAERGAQGGPGLCLGGGGGRHRRRAALRPRRRRRRHDPLPQAQDQAHLGEVRGGADAHQGELHPAPALQPQHRHAHPAGGDAAPACREPAGQPAGGQPAGGQPAGHQHLLCHERGGRGAQLLDALDGAGDRDADRGAGGPAAACPGGQGAEGGGGGQRGQPHQAGHDPLRAGERHAPGQTHHQRHLHQRPRAPGVSAAAAAAARAGPGGGARGGTRKGPPSPPRLPLLRRCPPAGWIGARSPNAALAACTAPGTCTAPQEGAPAPEPLAAGTRLGTHAAPRSGTAVAGQKGGDSSAQDPRAPEPPGTHRHGDMGTRDPTDRRMGRSPGGAQTSPPKHPFGLWVGSFPRAALGDPRGSLLGMRFAGGTWDACVPSPIPAVPFPPWHRHVPPLPLPPQPPKPGLARPTPHPQTLPRGPPEPGAGGGGPHGAARPGVPLYIEPQRVHTCTGRGSPSPFRICTAGFVNKSRAGPWDRALPASALGWVCVQHLGVLVLVHECARASGAARGRSLCTQLGGLGASTGPSVHMCVDECKGVCKCAELHECVRACTSIYKDA